MLQVSVPLLNHQRPRRNARTARIDLVAAYLLSGLGVADGVARGVVVGVAVGVAVGIAVGDGAGDMPGVGFGVTSGAAAGVGARIPEGIPGAAGRIPSGLASVEPVLFGAGPAAVGAFDEPPVLDAPLGFAVAPC